MSANRVYSFPSSLLHALQLLDDIVPASIRNDGRTELPEYAVPVASHGDTAARTQQGYCIGVSSDFDIIAITGKGQYLIIASDDDRIGAYRGGLDGR